MDKTKQNQSEGSPGLPQFVEKIGSQEAKVNGLVALGFKDPKGMHRRNLFTKNLPLEKYESAIKELRALGFSDPVKLIELAPGIPVGHYEGRIAKRVESFRLKGFVDVLAMAKKFPPLLTHSPEIIDVKVSFLRWKGFAEPLRMIEVFPAILNYSLENLREKIEAVRLGGLDYVSIYSKTPGMFSIAVPNLGWKLRYWYRVSKVLGLPLRNLESYGALVGVSREKLAAVIRTASKVEGGSLGLAIRLTLQDVSVLKAVCKKLPKDPVERSVLFEMIASVRGC